MPNIKGNQLNTGTSADQIVQLDDSGRLPAVDGSQLTGVGGGLFSEDVSKNIVGGANAGVNLVAGSPIIGGAENFLAGVGAGSSLTTGDYSIFIGNRAGDALTTDSNNILIGVDVLDTSTAAVDVIAIGNSVCPSTIATASRAPAIAIGHRLGGDKAGFISSIMIGRDIASGTGLTYNMYRCDIIGDKAGQYANNWQDSVAIGGGAGRGDNLAESTSLNSVVLVGRNAGEQVNDINGCTAIGYLAMQGSSTATTSGDLNTAIGALTIRDLTTGSNNTAIGYESLSDINAGSGNTGLGFRTGETITSGSNNICIGSSAGPGFGAGQTANDLLYIDISRRDDPLIGGDFGSPRIININGNLSISGTLHSAGSPPAEWTIPIAQQTSGDPLGIDLGEYTVATLPAAGTYPSCQALATDASGGRTVVRSDGTNWKVVVVEGATVTT